MGYQTDFVGYLQIDPPLSSYEIDLVNRVSGSIYLDERPGGLRVADEHDEAMRELTAKRPNGWSNWSACPTGCCLSYDGGDKANHMVPWLSYLMCTFLVPGAAAAGRPGLEEVTTDHVLNGVVVGSRRDNGELYAITVRDNNVEIEMLWPGNTEWSSYPPLAYQVKIDRFREWVVAYKASPEFAAERSGGSRPPR